VRPGNGVGGGDAGVKAHPQKFGMLKIRAKYLKVWKNTLKIREKMAPNVV